MSLPKKFSSTVLKHHIYNIFEKREQVPYGFGKHNAYFLNMQNVIAGTSMENFSFEKNTSNPKIINILGK